jgi:hypothetical protein
LFSSNRPLLKCRLKATWQLLHCSKPKYEIARLSESQRGKEGGREGGRERERGREGERERARGK